MNSAAVAQVIPLLQPADRRQAAYYRAELEERQALVDDEIAVCYAALGACKGRGDLRGVHRIGQVIRDKQKEQFELHRLRVALGRRFFPKPATAATRVRCFDVEITRDGSWWRIGIPDLDDVTTARHHGSAEMPARERIAFSTATPIAQVAVRIVGDHG